MNLETFQCYVMDSSSSHIVLSTNLQQENPYNPIISSPWNVDSEGSKDNGVLIYDASLSKTLWHLWEQWDEDFPSYLLPSI